MGGGVAAADKTFTNVYEFQEHDVISQSDSSANNKIWGCLHPKTDEIWSMRQQPGDKCIWSGVDGLEDQEDTYAEVIEIPHDNRPYRQDEYAYNECYEISSKIENEIDRSGCRRSQPGDEWTNSSEWCGDDEGICVRFLKVNEADGGWIIEGDFGEYLGGAGGGGYASDPGFESEEECLSHPWCTGIWGSSDVELETGECYTFDETKCEDTPYCWWSPEEWVEDLSLGAVENRPASCEDKIYSPEGIGLKGSLEEHLFPGRCVVDTLQRLLTYNPDAQVTSPPPRYSHVHEARYKKIGDPKLCFEESDFTVWLPNDVNVIRDTHERFGHVHPSILKYYDESSGAHRVIGAPGSQGIDGVESPDPSHRGVNPTGTLPDELNWDLQPEKHVDWNNDESAWNSTFNIWDTMNEGKRNTLWNGSPGVDLFHERTLLPFLPNTQPIDLQEGSDLSGVPQIGTYGWNPDEPTRNMGWNTYTGTVLAYNPNSEYFREDSDMSEANDFWPSTGKGAMLRSASTTEGIFNQRGHPEYGESDSKHRALSERPYDSMEEVLDAGMDDGSDNVADIYNPLGLHEGEQFVSIYHNSFLPGDLKSRTDLQIPRMSGGVHDPSTEMYGKYGFDIEQRITQQNLEYDQTGDMIEESLNRGPRQKQKWEEFMDMSRANIHNTDISRQNELIYPGSTDWSWGCKWIKNPGSSRVRHSEQFNILMEKCTQNGTCRWNPVCSEDPQDYRWESLTSNWVPMEGDTNQDGLCRLSGFCRSSTASTTTEDPLEWPEAGSPWSGGEPALESIYMTPTPVPVDSNNHHHPPLPDYTSKVDCETAGHEWVITGDEYLDVDEVECGIAGGTWFNPGEEYLSKPVRTYDERLGEVTSGLHPDSGDYDFGRKEKMAGAGGYGGIKVRNEYETYSKVDNTGIPGEGVELGSVHNIHEPSYSGGLDFYPGMGARGEDGDGSFLPGWRDGHWNSACGSAGGGERVGGGRSECIEGFTNNELYVPKDICYRPQDEYEQTQYSGCPRYLNANPKYNEISLGTVQAAYDSMRLKDTQSVAENQSCEVGYDKYWPVSSGDGVSPAEPSRHGWSSECSLGGGFNFTNRRSGADEIQEQIYQRVALDGDIMNVFPHAGLDGWEEREALPSDSAHLWTARRDWAGRNRMASATGWVSPWRDISGSNEYMEGGIATGVGTSGWRELGGVGDWPGGHEWTWRGCTPLDGCAAPDDLYEKAYLTDTVGWDTAQHRSEYLPPYLWNSWMQNANVSYENSDCASEGKEAPCVLDHPLKSVDPEIQVTNPTLYYEESKLFNHRGEPLGLDDDPRFPDETNIEVGDIAWPPLYQNDHRNRQLFAMNEDVNLSGSSFAASGPHGRDWPPVWVSKHHVLKGGTSHFSEDTGIPAEELILNGLRGRSVNRWDAECNWVDIEGNLIDIQRAGEPGSYVYCSDEHADLFRESKKSNIVDTDVAQGASPFIRNNAIPYPKWNEREKLDSWALLPYMGDPDQALQFQWNPSTWRAGIFHPGIPSDPGLGDANGMGDSSLFGYTKGGMKRYENRLLWEVTENKYDSYDPVIKDRVLNKRHGESMMSSKESSLDNTELMVEPKGPTTRHWRMQNKPRAYGGWKNCCMPEPRGIWQQDLPKVPPAKGRVWEGTGSSKIRSENESGWKIDSHIKGERAGGGNEKDYIGRSCDTIAADAYDSFRSGILGNSETIEHRTIYRYGGEELGSLYKDGRWYNNWDSDIKYDSATDTTVDYIEPTGDFLTIWNSDTNNGASLMSDRDRFRNECIESDCMWISPEEGRYDSQDGAQCVDKITLNGIITFEHRGTVQGAAISSELLLSNCSGVDGGDDWIWLQLDTKPGRADRGWFVDIEPGIKNMIKDFFKENGVTVDNSNIIIENNLINSLNPSENMSDGSNSTYCGYTMANRKHPIRYTLNIPCGRHHSTDECIEEYKQVQRKFTKACENGSLSMVIERKGIFKSLSISDDYPTTVIPGDPYYFQGWTTIATTEDQEDNIPTVRWITQPTEPDIKTCYHTKHNCKYHEKNITLGKYENSSPEDLIDVYGSFNICSGSDVGDEHELCTDSECCTTDVVYCHDGEDINDPDGRYNKSLSMKDSQGNSIAGSITLDSYRTTNEDGEIVQVGIPRSGLTDTESQNLRERYIELKTGLTSDPGELLEFIKEYGLCRGVEEPLVPLDTRSITPGTDIACAWDLGYTHIGGLVLEDNKWNDIDETLSIYGSDYGCPSKSSDWTKEDPSIASPPGWLASPELGGVEYEGGYCMKDKDDDITTYTIDEVNDIILGKSKAECISDEKFWKHGPILCGAINDETAGGGKVINTGEDMCKASTNKIEPENIIQPATCTPNPVLYGPDAVRPECEVYNMVLKSVLGVDQDTGEGSNFDNARIGCEAEMDSGNKACIYNNPSYEFSGVAENHVCQLGVCAPQECLDPADDNYPGDCKMRSGKHYGGFVHEGVLDVNYNKYMTNDIESIGGLKRRDAYATCETVGHDCSKSLLDTSTEAYGSTQKDCYNYIMRSPNWSGGGDSTDNLGSVGGTAWRAENAYLYGCDGIPTNEAPKEIRMVQPCKEYRDLNVETAEGTWKDQPRCFDEGKLLTDTWAISDAPFNKQLLIPNSCCESVLNDDCDSYEGGGLCFEGLNEEGTGGRVKELHKTRDTCETRDGLYKWVSGCSKSKLYWSESNPTATITDINNNWIRELFSIDGKMNDDQINNLLFSALAPSEDATTGEPTSREDWKITGEIDQNKKDFWEKAHPPRMIYDSFKWGESGRGSDYLMFLFGGDQQVRGHINSILNKAMDRKLSHVSSTISNQNNDTWREGPCTFACANYRDGDVSGPLRVDGSGDTLVAEEMRERCNMCLAYGTIE